MTEEQWYATWELVEQASTLEDSLRWEFIESSSADPAVKARAIELLSDPGEPAPPPPAADEPQIGEMVGRYRLKLLLSRTGSGLVFSADDTELDRTVALKFLAQETLGSGPVVARLIREARAASALNHPNIVTIYDVVRTGCRIAIVMELIEGRVLRDVVSRDVRTDQLLLWFNQVAQALSSAHSLGIIHRDIKPENIMVRDDGYVKVLDFGLARQFAGDISSTPGLPVGTLRYMSPEQIRGAKLTPASDVFALGVVMYECITGTHPFAAEFVIETTNAIVAKSPARPSSFVPTIPTVLETAILDMLEKAPSRRPSMESVVKRLQDALRQVSLDARKGPLGNPRGTSLGRFGGAVSAGLLLLTAVTLAAMLMRCN